MKIQFMSLASGSSGNCYYLGTDSYGILIDAGIGIRTIRKRLKDEGIPFERRSARQITPSDYDRFDYIILMEQYNYRNAMRIFGDDPEGKVKLLLDFAGSGRDIADPWYTGNFDRTYDDLVEGLTALLHHIKENDL